MANEPIIKLRDFGVSTAVFEWKNDNKKSYSISLQRSYKKKDSDEYVNETINLYPEDLLKYAQLLEQTYQKYVNYRISEFDKTRGSKPTTTQPSAPAQNVTSAAIDDDIPFN